MSALTPDDLAYARRVQQEFMPQTCTREQRLTTSDGSGGEAEVWLPLPGTIPCRLGDANRDLPDDVQDRLKGNDAYYLTLPADTPLGYRDRFVITGEGRYEAIMVVAGRSWETARRIYVMKVE